MKEQKQKYYFTFACGADVLHRNGYHVIEADNEQEARNIMNSRFDTWAFCYKSADAAGVAEFHLHEVSWPLPLPLPKMFTVTIEWEAKFQKELAEEFRTLQAATLYVADCVRTLLTLEIAPNGENLKAIIGRIRNPKGELIWWMTANSLHIE